MAAARKLITASKKSSAESGKIYPRKTLKDTITRPSKRVQKHFQVQTETRFEQLPGKDLTVMNIVSNDRPGLLARIALAFVECDVRIHNAKMATAGEKANDTFHITDSKNQPLLDEGRLQQLRDALKKHLNN